MTRRAVTMAVLVAALFAIWHIWPSDERRIRRLVDELAQALQPADGEPELARAARLAPLSRHLADDVVVEAPSLLTGRDQVLAAALQASRVAGLSLRVHGVQVMVERSRATATTTMGVTISGTNPATAQTWREISEVRLELARRDDEWIVTRIAPVAALVR